MNFTRRSLLSLLAMSAASGALANAPTRSLRPLPKPADAERRALPSAERLISDAKLGGKTSFAVADAQTGEVLDTYQPLSAHPPASVTKAVTALYALDRLGVERRFATELVATGPIRNGVLEGDLVLAGGGDPTLDTDGLEQLASALEGWGLKRISGQFRVWGGALPGAFEIDPSQPDHVGYNPAITGLNLNFNRVFMEWKRDASGYAITMDGRSERLRPRVRVAEARIADRKSPVFTYEDVNGRDRWSVARTALGKGGGRWLPVREVDAYVGEVFREVAAQQGIRLPAPGVASSAPRGSVLAQEVSGSMASQVQAMLKYSTNLTAEVTGLTTTRQRGASARTLAASAREMTAWAKTSFGVRQAKFVDHSGLGDGSRIGADEMVQILTRSGWNGPLRAVLKDIKLVNSKGKPAPIAGVSVKAKTGTLNFASALSGYIECPNGRRLAFAIFSADMKRRAAISRAQRERPEGGRAWRKRAKAMQQKLLRHWALEYGVSS